MRHCPRDGRDLILLTGEHLRLEPRRATGTASPSWRHICFLSMTPSYASPISRAADIPHPPKKFTRPSQASPGGVSMFSANFPLRSNPSHRVVVFGGARRGLESLKLLLRALGASSRDGRGRTARGRACLVLAAQRGLGGHWASGAARLRSRPTTARRTTGRYPAHRPDGSWRGRCGKAGAPRRLRPLLHQVRRARDVAARTRLVARASLASSLPQPGGTRGSGGSSTADSGAVRHSVTHVPAAGWRQAGRGRPAFWSSPLALASIRSYPFAFPSFGARRLAGPPATSPASSEDDA